MEILFIVLTVVGLSLFEIITSIDNAIINAEVLGTMGQKARKWFLTWGIFFAVFVMRGISHATTIQSIESIMTAHAAGLGAAPAANRARSSCCTASGLP
jgi:hypothetical protein